MKYICLLLLFIFNMNVLADNLQVEISDVASEVVSEDDNKKKINQSIPYKKDSDVSTEKVAEVVFVFVFLILLTILVLFIARKYVLKLQPVLNDNKKELHVLESKRVSTGLTLYLIEFNSKKILLGHSADSLTVIDKSDILKVDKE